MSLSLTSAHTCAQVALQIRSAQQKAALAGQAPPAWAIGAACHALSALHEDWREAVVKGISAAGNFVVAFMGRDDLEEVCPEVHPSPLRVFLACYPLDRFQCSLRAVSWHIRTPLWPGMPSFRPTPSFDCGDLSLQCGRLPW